jgi:anthranilate synthase component 1
MVASQRNASIFPVWEEVICDGETPVGVYARVRDSSEPCFMLESVVGQERWARYSFLGVGYRARVTGRFVGEELEVEVKSGDGFELSSDLRERLAAASGLDVVRVLLDHFRADSIEGLPRFWGGVVGVFGHELVRTIEKLPVPAHHSKDRLPVFELLVTDTLVIFDNLSQRVKVVSCACGAEDGGDAAARVAAQERVARVMKRLRQPGVTLSPFSVDEEVEVRAELAPQAAHSSYPKMVEQAREYIHAGDVFQLVLSQPFEEDAKGLDPLSVYRTLRFTNPAPYMYLLELDAATLVGASPEVLVRVEPTADAGRRVTVRPLAGTRRRGKDKAEDEALERELLADPKERAEHLMLIDLGRNDVGRIAEAGSVTCGETFAIERYSRVMHIVSEVSGTLREDLDALDALRATFPAGTLSGAPKVRALELIDALEATERGWYGGAVGYFGFDGGADFAICIRSVVVRDDKMRVQAGAGLVFDSVPANEDDECHRKASAVVRAIAMARQTQKSSEEGQR